MKITLENTDRIVAVEVDGCAVDARIWQGETEFGVPVHAYITRIVPEIPESHSRIDELTQGFDEQLKRTVKPRPAVEVIPLRLIL